MRALLVGVPGFHTQDEPMFPLGIGYLISSLNKGGHEAVGAYFIREEHIWQSLPIFLSRFNPDLVGISCNTFNRGMVRKTVKFVKYLNHDAKVVLGGVHSSYLSHQAIRDYGADYVVIGEGEESLVDLCNCLEKGESLVGVSGIAWKDENNSIYSGRRGLLRNLDSLPPPDYSFASHMIQESNMGYVITSRGCPVRCKFCSSGSFWGQEVRSHSPVRVIHDIESQVGRFGVNRIRFHDNTFNFDADRVIEICNLILKRGLKITWGASCRVSPISSDMIGLMVESGCRDIAWGVESGSKTMLEKMGKKITQEQIRYAYELCEPYIRLGVLSTRTYTMVGFPGETDETVQESIDFLNSLLMTHRPECQVVYVLPGTQLWEDQNVVGDNYWTDTDEVLYVNRITGQDSGVLYRWAKAIEDSGKRTPFDPDRHFWKGVTSGKIPEPKNPVFSGATV